MLDNSGQASLGSGGRRHQDNDDNPAAANVSTVRRDARSKKEAA
jgi:hypothetical protein